MQHYKTAQHVLQEVFGYSQFRGLQEEVVRSLCQLQDTVAVLPTGAGKSLCFQVPGLVLGGTTVVISPLISLMHDQVASLHKKGVRALAYTSELTAPEKAAALSAIQNRTMQFVYVSPESIHNKAFVAASSQANIKVLAVDEAHCIAEWGDDFRPEYQHIALFIKKLPSRPVIAALTATATTQTLDTIGRYLELSSPKFVSTATLRTNISWHTITAHSWSDKVLATAAVIQRFSQEPVIIYAQTRQKVAEFHELFEQSLAKTHSQRVCCKYHGGMSATDKKTALETFLIHPAPVLFATNAFGMGIDNPRVRCVVHIQPPATIESWYQEVGRAGRDGSPAFSFSIVDPQDWQLHHHRIEAHPQASKKASQLSSVRALFETNFCVTRQLQEYFSLPTTGCTGCSNCQNQLQSIEKLIVWCASHTQQSVQLTPQLDWRQKHPIFQLFNLLTKQDTIPRT